MYAAVLLLCAATASLLHPARGCICPLSYNPVCGDDGRTYENMCVLHCQNLMNLIGGGERVAIRCNNACDDSMCVGSRETLTYNKKYVVAPKYYPGKK